ncbi:SagB/ThcOx family dehydrogenase [Paenibacillus dendritiformis]|uniref:SagB/ThcOx family dehydrogenase n=1 Tax=Paenibacillus dendritiformis TaxID=130049 RepID=UPI000DA9108D|nr:SagB/ThcOx family dehydrogenase [Paenibacillus dendritiformis]PZM63238.1 hypothetical protein DOE73_22940 [Paenibacillus dendritiformis]
MRKTEWFNAVSDNAYYSRSKYGSIPYALDELYHENSKYIPALQVMQSPSYHASYPDFAAYEQCESVSLPDRIDHQALDAKIGEVLMNRRSSRSFSNTVEVQDLFTLLRYATGVSERSALKLADGSAVAISKRTYPTGGARYAVEIFFYAHAIEGMDPGMYMYCPHRNRIFTIWKRRLTTDEVNRMFFVIKEPGTTAFHFETASIFFMLSANFKDLRDAYGLRSYRMIHKESGHISQNLLLIAAGMKLQAVPVEGFFDEYVNELVQLDGVDRSVLYLTLIG